MPSRVPFHMALIRVGVSLTAILLFLMAALERGRAQTRWVGSWAASQQLVEPRNALNNEDLRDVTLRQIVHLSMGGAELRVHVSNRFGSTSLYLSSLHIAKPISAAAAGIAASTDRAVTFSGKPDIIVPAGADYISDPVPFTVSSLSDLAITLRIDQIPVQQTGHPGSRATSYLAHGDLVSAGELPDAKKVEHWYFISGVDVGAPAEAASVVVLGDSITDGHGATTDGNNRWTDVLARRLEGLAPTRTIGVLNQGIGGNRLLVDGLGPNALARFDHDVVAQAGVHWLIVLEGVNDMGMLTRDRDIPLAEHQALVRRILGAYEQIITRAHAHGIQVIGATILPYIGSEYYHPGASSEADRQAVNQWIRSPGHFDAVIDFDQVMRDPEHVDRLLPAFDFGDHLHPSPRGYAAMAEAVPLSLFEFNTTPAGTPVPKIAVTFDDLPAHGLLPPGETRLRIASKILAALREAHVPEAYGFVNGLPLDEHPEDSRVLQAWRAAGYPLGNHSWSHMNLNQHPPEVFQADVNRNEAVLLKWMNDGDWHWFRFPFLSEGDTPEKGAMVRTFLRDHGYKIAGVTMSFSDYQWNEPYARCRAKGDRKAIATLENSYMAAAEASIAYYRQLSRTLYGRDIAYVLLMHIGGFDAEMLPRLLKLYESRGFTFVTLAEAESDEFYRQDIDLGLPGGFDTLEGAMAERHLAVPHRVAPAAQLYGLCR